MRQARQRKSPAPMPQAQPEESPKPCYFVVFEDGSVDSVRVPHAKLAEFAELMLSLAAQLLRASREPAPTQATNGTVPPAPNSAVPQSPNGQVHDPLGELNNTPEG